MVVCSLNHLLSFGHGSQNGCFVDMFITPAPLPSLPKVVCENCCRACCFDSAVLSLIVAMIAHSGARLSMSRYGGMVDGDDFLQANRRLVISRIERGRGWSSRRGPFSFGKAYVLECLGYSTIERYKPSKPFTGDLRVAET